MVHDDTVWDEGQLRLGRKEVMEASRWVLGHDIGLQEGRRPVTQRPILRLRNHPRVLLVVFLRRLDPRHPTTPRYPKILAASVARGFPSPSVVVCLPDAEAPGNRVMRRDNDPVWRIVFASESLRRLLVYDPVERIAAEPAGCGGGVAARHARVPEPAVRARPHSNVDPPLGGSLVCPPSWQVAVVVAWRQGMPVPRNWLGRSVSCIG